MEQLKSVLLYLHQTSLVLVAAWKYRLLKKEMKEKIVEGQWQGDKLQKRTEEKKFRIQGSLNVALNHITRCPQHLRQGSHGL